MSGLLCSYSMHFPESPPGGDHGLTSVVSDHTWMADTSRLTKDWNPSELIIKFLNNKNLMLTDFFLLRWFKKHHSSSKKSNFGSVIVIIFYSLIWQVQKRWFNIGSISQALKIMHETESECFLLIGVFGKKSVTAEMSNIDVCYSKLTLHSIFLLVSLFMPSELCHTLSFNQFTEKLLTWNIVLFFAPMPYNKIRKIFQSCFTKSSFEF